MNCRTCAHNRYEPAFSSGRPEDGMINNCTEPGLVAIQGADSGVPLIPIEVWMRAQSWDDECMCPLETDPCPGWQAKEAA